MEHGTVYFVHAVDTEGPLYEGLEATFQQILEHFSVRLDPTWSNIEKLRGELIPLAGKERAISDFVREDRISRYNESWDQIDKMHETVMSKKWREKLKDGAGFPYVISWHCMDHVGFNYNPRRRAMGFHEVFKYYQKKIIEFGLGRDRVYWHYHPMSFSRDAHRMGRNYSFSNLHNEILSRRIIDHGWFPVAHRPGGHIETYDINAWLESWIPFDLSNQNMAVNESLKEEEKSGRVPGRYGDWRGAVTSWDIYHPCLYDYRKKGELKRWIGRCLNLNSRHSNLNETEIEKAFVEANTGTEIMVSYTNHDFRDMINDIEDIVGIIRQVATRYPQVNFRWANTVEAFRAGLDLPKKSPGVVNADVDGNVLRISVSDDIWGCQPFLALRTKEGNYYHDNLIIDNEKHWSYVFDPGSIELDALSNIGFAFNDCVGNTVVCPYDCSSCDWNHYTYNTTDWIES